MQHPNTNSVILLPNFTMNIHLLVHQTSQTYPNKLHVSIPSSFDTTKFSISWNWSLVHTEYSTLILHRLCRKHTETQEGRYSVLVSSLLSLSGVGWVDLWLSQEVRLDDGSQSGGEVNLPPPFEETYVPPLPFFFLRPPIDFVSGKRSSPCRKYDPRRPRALPWQLAESYKWLMAMGCDRWGWYTGCHAEVARSSSRRNKVSIKGAFFCKILWPVRWKIGNYASLQGSERSMLLRLTDELLAF